MESSINLSNIKNLSPKESIINNTDNNQSIDKTLKILYAVYENDLSTLITYKIKGFDL